MQIKNAVVLITGANRGIGLAFAREALARGAKRVYAASRQPAKVTLDGVVPVELDVTRPEQVARAARELGDVTLLINNAGVAEFGGFLVPDALEALRRAQLFVYHHPGEVKVLANRAAPTFGKVVKQPPAPPKGASDPKKSPTKHWAAFVLSGTGR